MFALRDYKIDWQRSQLAVDNVTPDDLKDFIQEVAESNWVAYPVLGRNLLPAWLQLYCVKKNWHKNTQCKQPRLFFALCMSTKVIVLLAYFPSSHTNTGHASRILRALKKLDEALLSVVQINQTTQPITNTVSSAVDNPQSISNETMSNETLSAVSLSDSFNCLNKLNLKSLFYYFKWLVSCHDQVLTDAYSHDYLAKYHEVSEQILQFLCRKNFVCSLIPQSETKLVLRVNSIQQGVPIHTVNSERFIVDYTHFLSKKYQANLIATENFYAFLLTSVVKENETWITGFLNAPPIKLPEQVFHDFMEQLLADRAIPTHWLIYPSHLKMRSCGGRFLFLSDD